MNSLYKETISGFVLNRNEKEFDITPYILAI